jgi:hypothetical protein
MVGTVLAIVEHMQLGEIAEAISIIQPQRRAARLHRVGKRHVFPESLIGCGTLREEAPRIGVGRRDVTGVVVGDLVVVPGHDPGMRRVRGLQVGVGLVEGVPQPVVLQRHGLPVEDVGQHPVGVLALAARGVDGVLVEIVTEMEDDIDVLLGEMTVGGEVPVVVRLAGDGGEGERGGPGA